MWGFYLEGVWLRRISGATHGRWWGFTAKSISGIKAVGKQIKSQKAVGIFAGPTGPGPWQNMEIEAFLRKTPKNSKFSEPLSGPGQNL